jgi:hypothetical protein
MWRRPDPRDAKPGGRPAMVLVGQTLKGPDCFSVRNGLKPRILGGESCPEDGQGSSFTPRAELIEWMRYGVLWKG